MTWHDVGLRIEVGDPRISETASTDDAPEPGHEPADAAWLQTGRTPADRSALTDEAYRAILTEARNRSLRVRREVDVLPARGGGSRYLRIIIEQPVVHEESPWAESADREV